MQLVMSCYVMLCYVVVHNRLPPANPSLVSGWGQGTPWTSRQLIAGPSLMSNVGFNISLKDTTTCSSALPGAGIWTSDPPITSQPALPAELQPPENATSTYKKKKKALCNRKKKIWEEKNEMEREDSREVFTQVSKSCEGIGSLEEVWSGIKTSSFCRNTQN